MAAQDQAVAEVLLRALRRGRRAGGARGRRVRRASTARSPSAGSGSSCRACPAPYDEIFLPLHGEHQARNAALALAAVEALFGAGPRQPLDPDAVRAGFAAVRSPGRLERVAAGADVATVLRRRRAQPARRPRARRGADRGVPLHPARRRCVGGDARQGRPRHPRRAGAGARRDRRHGELVAAGDGPRRAGRARGGGVRRRAGERRRRRCAQAIEQARELAEEEGDVRGRRDRHRLGRHGGGGAHAVRPGAA